MLSDFSNYCSFPSSWWNTSSHSCSVARFPVSFSFEGVTTARIHVCFSQHVVWWIHGGQWLVILGWLIEVRWRKSTSSPLQLCALHLSKGLWSVVIWVMTASGVLQSCPPSPLLFDFTKGIPMKLALSNSSYSGVDLLLVNGPVGLE